jgi:hypothetical protein
LDHQLAHVTRVLGLSAVDDDGEEPYGPLEIIYHLANGDVRNYHDVCRLTVLDAYRWLLIAEKQEQRRKLRQKDIEDF